MDAISFQVDAELIRRFDRPGPRYTSYPTADRFVTTFGAEAYRSCAAHRNTGGIERGLALYVHLPFCRDVCFYCACNKIVTRDALRSCAASRSSFSSLTDPAWHSGRISP